MNSYEVEHWTPMGPEVQIEYKVDVIGRFEWTQLPLSTNDVYILSQTLFFNKPLILTFSASLGNFYIDSYAWLGKGFNKEYWHVYIPCSDTHMQADLLT